MEPWGCLVTPHGDDEGVTAQCPTQGAAAMQGAVAAALGCGLHLVQIQSRRVGGGFGARNAPCALVLVLLFLLFFFFVVSVVVVVFSSYFGTNTNGKDEQFTRRSVLCSGTTIRWEGVPAVQRPGSERRRRSANTSACPYGPEPRR